MKDRRQRLRTNPFSLAEMRMVIRKELDVRNLREENRSCGGAGQRYSHPNIASAQPQNAGVLATVERVARQIQRAAAAARSGRGKDLIRPGHS